ncbi:ADP-ribosylglycohydrolase family protein [Actinokineospora iranica]|uniref:ADP-ribosylglycohydrolase n=1 Tax=Actinokineospora iranica TaxID=1271860 RepID=A0A1G6WXZ9_9PSEU|nr:ADP-ribosylglycohydrolase family protein [Actinokineospora iranica]SDD70679.1 ADP-ribosylglycohydrolase [Actinokineospora iranica]
MVELAVGDAYGAGFEYADAAFVAERNTLRGYVPHPRHRSLRPGSYTDDTQMSIAVAEVLVSGDPWTAPTLADAFVRVFHRDRREGYAAGFHGLLCQVRDGEELLRRLRPASDKSGAAMRSAPLGLLPTVPEVLRHTEIQARVTHDTPDGVESAQAAALAVHYCHFGLGPVAEVGRWIDSRLTDGAGGWARPWQGKVGAQGRMSVRAALTALAANDTLSGLLRACVAFTGDVDTVATIAIAAASRSAEFARDLPPALLDGLERGPYGFDYLAELDARLPH